MSEDETKQDGQEVEIQDVDLKETASRMGPPHKSFTMTWTTAEGVRVTGTFTAERPNLGAVGRIAILKSRLNGGEQLDRVTDFIHEMQAFLQVVLVEAPAQWKPETLFDALPLRKAWDHVQAWLKTFH